MVSGSTHLVAAMRALFVVFDAKAIKGALLGRQVRSHGIGRLALEGAVHALMPAILFGVARTDTLRQHPQLDPPDQWSWQPKTP